MANKWIQLSNEEISFIKAAISPSVLDESVFPEKKKLLAKLSKAEVRIKISSAKGKGRELQYWVCRKISELTGLPYVQQDDQCLIHSREMGQQGTDIVLRGEAQTKFPFAIECKSTEEMSMLSFVRQAAANIKPGLDWLVVYRSKSLTRPVAVMDWDTLEKLWKQAQGRK